jgi:2-hydroxy-3-keto-5-methylthiopentenyl-1-phosphate phosphatase
LRSSGSSNDYVYGGELILFFYNKKSGLHFLVKKVLTKYLGEKAEEIEIVANNGSVKGKKWEIIYLDDT